VSQVEGVVTKNEIAYKPRRQLLVTIADETGDIQLRFMNFYGSQVKQLAEGTRVRARAEVRHGFFGAEMVHPVYKIVNEGAPLPNSLTPVYPAGEGLSQTDAAARDCRRHEARRLADTVPRAVREKLRWPSSSRPCACCTTRRRTSTRTR
jgi:ATP-dependent DNA helicase RecG